MKGMDDANRLLGEALAKAGVRWRSVPIGRLEELRSELAARRASGEIDEVLWREMLAKFSFDAGDRRLPAAAVLLLAMGQPQVRVPFVYRGERHVLRLPPIFLKTANREAARVLSEVLEPLGHWAAPKAVPVKLLAARTGLSRYGRNSLAFVDGLGSYCKLLAFVTSLPPVHGDWSAPMALERCARCTRCVRACPMGAIDAERFLTRAEKCLTFYNERPGELPGRIPAKAHHCIFGCMFCQAVCPENTGLLATVDAAGTFSEEETGAILCGVSKERLSGAALSKLEGLDLLEDYPLLGRNLRAILDRETGSR